MERYFSQPEEAKMRDARPDLHYQVSGLGEGGGRAWARKGEGGGGWSCPPQAP